MENYAWNLNPQVLTEIEMIRKMSGNAINLKNNNKNKPGNRDKECLSQAYC